MIQVKTLQDQFGPDKTKPDHNIGLKLAQILYLNMAVIQDYMRFYETMRDWVLARYLWVLSEMLHRDSLDFGSGPVNFVEPFWG